MLHFKALQNPVELKEGNHTVRWGDAKSWALFAGPDIIEDEGMVLEVGQEMKRLTQKYGISWILKCSYDKANRQSAGSFRGPGWKEGLNQLGRIKSKLDCLLLTDVHETNQVDAVAEVADVIQIPAFLCRQTDLVVAAAEKNKVLHIKKGQFMAPWDMKAICDKAVKAGNKRLLLCERGTTFGYNRLVTDMPGLAEMRSLGFPAIMDCSHSLQQPGATGGSSSGNREMIPVMARAAMAAGVDGLFMEVHPNPDKALCDAQTSLALKNMETLLQQLNAIFKIHQSV